MVLHAQAIHTRGLRATSSLRLGTAAQARCGLHTGFSSSLRHIPQLQHRIAHAGIARATGQSSLRHTHQLHRSSSARTAVGRARSFQISAFMAQPKFGKTITQDARGVHPATVFIMHGKVMCAAQFALCLSASVPCPTRDILEYMCVTILSVHMQVLGIRARGCRTLGRRWRCHTSNSSVRPAVLAQMPYHKRSLPDCRRV